MGSIYYSDGTAQPKGVPVNAHSHVLDRSHFANVGVANDGSVATPKPGQGLFFVGNSPVPGELDPGKWFAGDAPTKAPVNETVLANWFEPTSWNPPNDDNPDGAAGTWRPIAPLTAGQSFSWEGPGPGGTDFGIPSETVDGYIRLRGDGLTVEWGAEVNSGARPIPYGAAGDTAAAEYVYKITVLCRALSDIDGALGPWLLSIGMAFYTNNVVRDSVNAPQPSLSKTVVWGANQVDITTEEGTDQWVSIDCFMNGRVLDGQLPADAPVGGRLLWDNDEADGPNDGYFFSPIIKVNGADVDMLIDSVQVSRGPRQITAPGGVLTTGVRAISGDYITSVEPQQVSTPRLDLQSDPDGLRPLLPQSLPFDADTDGYTTWFTETHVAFANPLPIVGETVVISWSDTQGARAAQGIPPSQHGLTFLAGETYVFDMSLIFAAGTYVTDAYIEVTSDHPGGTVVFSGAHQLPPDDGSAMDYTVEWTPDVDYADTTISIALEATQWTGETTAVQAFQISRRGETAGIIVGLGDPVSLDDPVTLGYLNSVDLGGGNTNIVHTPTVEEPEPPEDPDEPYEPGSLWVNPSAQAAVPTFFLWSNDQGDVAVQTGGGWLDIPTYEQMSFYAPCAGVLRLDAQVEVVNINRTFSLRLWYDDSSEHAYYIDRAFRLNTNASTSAIRISLMTNAIMYFDRPGSTIIKFQSSASVDSGYPKVGATHIWGEWVPGANVLPTPTESPSGSVAPPLHAPLARVKTEEGWQPATSMQMPGLGTLPPTITIVNQSTSTSLSGGGTQNGGTRTLTATVSSGGGTPTGSVQFKRGSTVVATKSLVNGKASYGVTNTGTTSWSANYLGGTSGVNKFLPSSSSTTSVTIRTKKTNTVTRNKNWRDMYPERNGSNPSDPAYTKNNSYYSQHDWRQGRVSSTWGNWKTMIGFTGVSGVSNLEKVTEVKFKIKIDHDWGSDLDLDIGWHTKGNRPNTFSVGNGAQNKQSANKTVGTREITLNSWARTAVARSDFRGIVLGSGSSGNTGHYGYGAGTLQLTITYEYWS